MGFDKSAYNYFISSDHAEGDDLNLLEAFFKNKSFSSLLDVASAAGHCSKVINADKKYTLDPSLSMLKTGREKLGLGLAVCAVAEFFPFADNSFDIVSCRIAMHHFSDTKKFFEEVKRVLRPNGWFVLIDSVVDVEDSYLNVLEFVRDATHVRSYRLEEVLSFAGSNFRLEAYTCIYKKHKFYEWASRLSKDENKILEIERSFEELPPNIQEVLNIERAEGKITSYTDKKGVYIFKSL